MTEAAQEERTGMPTPGPWTATGVQIKSGSGEPIAVCWYSDDMNDFEVAKERAALIVKAVNGHQARTWQPIGTAPKDGRYIMFGRELVRWNDSSCPTCFGFWNGDSLRWADACGMTIVEKHWPHWQPMPDAPEEARSAISEVKP